MKDRVYFGTNTKMYQTAAQTVEYLRCLEKRTRDLADGIAQRFVIPSYTALYPARRQLDRMGSQILLGAQNMGWEEQGEYTGEISPLMLAEAGARLVMIGHSERRHTFHETDAQAEKKVRCALDHGFAYCSAWGNRRRNASTALAQRCCVCSLKSGCIRSARRKQTGFGWGMNRSGPLGLAACPRRRSMWKKNTG